MVEMPRPNNAVFIATLVALVTFAEIPYSDAGEFNLTI